MKSLNIFGKEEGERVRRQNQRAVIQNLAGVRLCLKAWIRIIYQKYLEDIIYLDGTQGRHFNFFQRGLLLLPPNNVPDAAGDVPF